MNDTNLVKHIDDGLSLMTEMHDSLRVSDVDSSVITVSDLDEVTWEAYSVVMNDLGTVLYGFGQLPNGRWFSVEGGCDYTGWDCVGGADWFSHEDRQNVIDMGMTEEMRSHLGLPTVREKNRS